MKKVAIPTSFLTLKFLLRNPKTGVRSCQIQLEVAGARKLRFEEGGNLVLATAEGELLLRKPMFIR
jgi:hypothetical protein